VCVSFNDENRESMSFIFLYAHTIHHLTNKSVTFYDTEKNGK
jgi:hypothetical protein